MPLFSRSWPLPEADLRPREYDVVTPVICGDHVVEVDVTVRFDPVPARDDASAPLGWSAGEERALRAVVLLSLRLTGERWTAAGAAGEEEPVSRGAFADDLARSLQLAPIAAGFHATVTRLEVQGGARPRDPHEELRVVG